MEDCIASLNTEITDVDFICNVSLNKWMKKTFEERVNTNHEELISSVKIATSKLKQ
jgi:hypothetical protein